MDYLMFNMNIININYQSAIYNVTYHPFQLHQDHSGTCFLKL